MCLVYDISSSGPRAEQITWYSLFNGHIDNVCASLWIFLMHSFVISNANKVYKMCACVFFLALSRSCNFTYRVGLHFRTENTQIYCFFLFSKKNKWKQTNTNCIRIDQECVVYSVQCDCVFGYIRFILSLLVPRSQAIRFNFFILSLSREWNESERRINEIWKGCTMCVSVCVFVRACLCSLLFSWNSVLKIEKKRYFFRFIHWCGVMAWLKIRNGHKVEHITNKNMWRT